eukprot:scaffold60712_cov49-Phaeocystis_antarctica.AAC.1
MALWAVPAEEVRPVPTGADAFEADGATEGRGCEVAAHGEAEQASQTEKRLAVGARLALGLLEGLVLVGTEVHDDRTRPSPLVSRALSIVEGARVIPSTVARPVMRSTRTKPGGAARFSISAPPLACYHPCALVRPVMLSARLTLALACLLVPARRRRLWACRQDAPAAALSPLARREGANEPKPVAGGVWVINRQR